MVLSSFFLKFKLGTGTARASCCAVLEVLDSCYPLKLSGCPSFNRLLVMCILETGRPACEFPLLGASEFLALPNALGCTGLICLIQSINFVDFSPGKKSKYLPKVPIVMPVADWAGLPLFCGFYCISATPGSNLTEI